MKTSLCRICAQSRRIQTMKWQNWSVEITAKQASNSENYVIRNPDINGPIVNDVQYQESNFQEQVTVPEAGKNEEREATLKTRFKTGNLLLLALPICAATIPVVFILATFIHADQNSSLLLLNRTSTPYISDIGNFKPHSSVFTLGLVLGAFFMLGVVIVRFYQVRYFFRLSLKTRRSNFAGLVAGVCATFGMICVSAFQLSSHHSVHFISASIYFLSFSCYAVLQTWITSKQMRLDKSKCRTAIFCIRLAFTIGTSVNFLLFGIFLLPELSRFNRTGYSVAQIGEWISVSCIVGFLLTFVYDFWSIRPQVSVQDIFPKSGEP